ncbi:MAG: alpha/beta fold hydrolase [Acidobacteria bacterium]|nr:alpha/beta fold hydrolase [Acidobacteriota bacterium]MCK6684441.1 alpha/beta hydrolase [Thermoanaerobaculia bacterium]
MTLLAHQVDGSGEPLVLLNGGMMSWAAWNEIATPLARRFRVIRCDFRGQLRTPGPPPADFLEHAEDVARLLDHLGVERAHVAGASFGGEAGLVLAARHPSRVRSLVAFTVVDRFDGSMLAGLGALRAAAEEAAAGGERGPVYDLIARSAFSPAWAAANALEIASRRKVISYLPVSWFAGLAGLLASLEGLDIGSLLPSISCRTLVVLAGEDVTMPAERSLAVAAAIPGAETLLVPGAGHAVVAERPAESVSIITRFLESLAAENAAEGVTS